MSRISADEYLALEELAPHKHEFLNGIMYTLNGLPATSTVGGTRLHNLIALAVASSLRAQLKGTRCQVLMNDVKLHIEAADAYFYPDVMVTCDERDLAADLVMRAPTLVVEVLSPSTSTFDRADKFAAYRTLPSLAQYVLVASIERRIDVFTRAENWTATTAANAGDVLLTSLGVSLRFDDIYTGVA